MRRFFDLVNKNFESPLLLHRHFQKNDSRSPIITISREKGSGGRPIAYLVSKQLGKEWQIYHKDIVEEIAHETALEKELIENIDEKQAPLIAELINNIMGKQYLSLNTYYKHLLHILAVIGNRGHAVIVGRGANFLFPHALKVRIVSDMKTRISWIMKYERISAREAISRIKESDRKRTEFTKTLFQHDPRDANNYDIVIRTGDNMSVEDASEIIITLARKRFKMI